MEPKIRISSSRGSEFSSRFELDDKTYSVETEDLGIKKARIITRIYSKGEILSSVISNYAHLTELPDLHEKLRTMMEKQHVAATETFIKEHSRPAKSKAKYADEIKRYLTGGDKQAALHTAREALDRFPSDSFFLSYLGYLTAVVEDKAREGASICEEALTLLRKSRSTDIIFFLPLFHLHLGRAYMKGKRRELAIKAFREGLRYDSHDRELLSELGSLGTRKNPVLPFLKRSNAINKYLGKLRHDRQNRG